MANPSFAASKEGLEATFARAELRPQDRARALARAKVLLVHRRRYEAVAARTGVPWWWIAAVHERECSASFAGHLHNGDTLRGYTHHVPARRPQLGHGPPFSWEESAVDALTMPGKRLDLIRDWSVARAMYQWERYNGTGYISRGVNSPYLFGGTTLQQAGKYVADGKWSAKKWDSQLGCVAILKALLILEPDLLAAPAAPAAPAVSAGAAITTVGATGALVWVGDHSTLAAAAVTAVVLIATELWPRQAKGSPMIDVKSWTKSKTVWGGTLATASAVVPMAAKLAGYDVSGDDVTAAISAISAIGSAVGGLLAIYGRITASKQIGSSK